MLSLLIGLGACKKDEYTTMSKETLIGNWKYDCVVHHSWCGSCNPYTLDRTLEIRDNGYFADNIIAKNAL